MIKIIIGVIIGIFLLDFLPEIKSLFINSGAADMAIQQLEGLKK